MLDKHYDLIIVGTGFSSSFFLKQYLSHAKTARKRVLVLEHGEYRPHQGQILDRRWRFDEMQKTVNSNGRDWGFSLAFGGGSNCWWGCTPRMLPSDFKTNTLYGVGTDWPLSYEDLEPYYEQAEDIMEISGPRFSPYPRKKPYPLPSHTLNEADLAFLRAYPDSFFPMPTARPSQPTKTGRPTCCNSSVCHTCPIDSKFTIMNSMESVYRDERVELRFGARVLFVESIGGVVRKVVWENGNKETSAAATLVVLGANGIFNTEILLRSGMQHRLLGKRLNEQIAMNVQIDFEGTKSLQGSTSLTGHGYMIYDGPHRKVHAGALMETSNKPRLRLERGKWRETAIVKFIFEDLPDERNFIEIEPFGKYGRPSIHYRGWSSYTEKGLRALPDKLEKLLAPLPVTGFKMLGINETENHIQGTVVMSEDAEAGIVDPYLIHHKVRNLAVLGSSAFPTCPPANPTLTIAALALRTADHLLK